MPLLMGMPAAASTGIPLATKVLTGLGIGSGMLGGKQRSQMQGPTTQTVDMHRQTDPYNMGSFIYDDQSGRPTGMQALDFLINSGIGMLGGGMERSKQRQPQWDSIMSGIMGGFQDKYGG